jgi:short-chain fatty acids transporter
MLRALSRPLVRLVDRWLPSSLVFAIVLSFLVAALSLGLTDSGPVDVVRAWGDGLSSLLAFIAQISIVLVLGYVIAHTGPVQRLLVRIASIPRGPASAYAFVTVVAGLASLISWALGLIVGGIVALEVARAARRRGVRLHYPLLVASAYSGYVIWHMGYSGSGPLAAATPDSFFDEVYDLVPVSETTFASWNIAAAFVTLAAVTAAMVLLAPKGDDPIHELDLDAAGADGHSADDDGARALATAPAGAQERSSADAPGSGVAPAGQDGPDAAPTRDANDARQRGTSPAERIDGARAVTLALGVALVVYLVVYFAQEGFALTLDIVNWTFLAVILLIVPSAQALAQLVIDAGRTVGEVLLQYPLYAGILGMMTTTGLVEVFSEFFVGIATPGTLGVWAMLSGGLINMFIPSGGGQFAVQAPIFMDAAAQLGVQPNVVIMGIAYGDQWTNMIQPFWTLPLLAIAGLSVRDILGYTAVTLLVSGVVLIATLLLVGAG